MKSLFLISLLTAAAFAENITVTDAEAPATACHNSHWNLRPLMRDTDYESEVFTHMSSDWVVVFNFCRDTERSCMFAHFPAYMNSPNRGYRCLPTLTSGNWQNAEYSLERLGNRNPFANL
eukprot:TRINITY_DN0_c79_g1_i9.p2 TRINITY_DN0_c79_g1~~TRINITY_DN0_c79_g1_i9.p2  ORF type:complete len:120 (-),score=23.66 TRINITY_DN0_c79_g1_i9:307-666(-)